jgi:hypothetical protein
MPDASLSIPEVAYPTIVTICNKLGNQFYYSHEFGMPGENKNLLKRPTMIGGKSPLPCGRGEICTHTSCMSCAIICCRHFIFVLNIPRQASVYCRDAHERREVAVGVSPPDESAAEVTR